MVQKKTYKIVWLPLAGETMQLLHTFLSISQSRTIANNVVTGIMEAVDDIKTFPLKFQHEPALGKKYRYAIVWSYKVIYKVEDDVISVVLIFHTSQSTRKLKKLLK